MFQRCTSHYCGNACLGAVRAVKGDAVFFLSKKYYTNLEIVPFLSFGKGYHSFENSKLMGKSWSSEWSL